MVTVGELTSPDQFISLLIAASCTLYIMLRIKWFQHLKLCSPTSKTLLWFLWLGHSHYIVCVWSARSSDVMKLCPMRKNWHIVFLFILFHPANLHSWNPLTIAIVVDQWPLIIWGGAWCGFSRTNFFLATPLTIFFGPNWPNLFLHNMVLRGKHKEKFLTKHIFFFRWPLGQNIFFFCCFFGDPSNHFFLFCTMHPSRWLMVNPLVVLESVLTTRCVGHFMVWDTCLLGKFTPLTLTYDLCPLGRPRYYAN